MVIVTKFAEPWQSAEPFIEALPHPIDVPNWLIPLQQAAVRPSAARGFDFGDATGEATAALDGDALIPLSQSGGIQVQGRDADTFLQGQLSNDVAALRADQAQISSYNSPKGRVLAVLIGTRHQGGVQLETRLELVPALLKRLRMFVLRAQVQLADVSTGEPQIGLAGPNSSATLSRLGLPAPATDWGVGVEGAVRVVRRPGPLLRYSVQAPELELADLWTRMVGRARPCGPAAWRLLDLLGGLPSVTNETQDHFVAQMLNLDTLGGISFSKGCYTGQEVVARLHYLGKLKRRMFLAFCTTEAAPGTPVHLAEGDSQAVGEVVDSALHPKQGAALLVVLQTQHAGEALRLHSNQGAELRMQPATPGDANEAGTPA